MTAGRHRMGRKARMYPDLDTLRMLVEIDGDSVKYIGPYKSKPIRDKGGHLIIKLPLDLFAVERKQRKAHYFRVDHIVWALTLGEWPDGWIEHLNGLRHDCTMDNLVLCDPEGVRWWHLNDELVEVQGDGLRGTGPITYRVTDGDTTFVLPKLVGVTYEEEDEPAPRAKAPHPQGVGVVPEVPNAGQNDQQYSEG